jgi:hypothetical protein
VLTPSCVGPRLCGQFCAQPVAVIDSFSTTTINSTLRIPGMILFIEFI